MKKFHGPKKIKTAVFISGKGTNLKNLFKFSLLKKSPISINLVISSNLKAEGLIFSKKNKIQNKVLKFLNKSEDETKALKVLKKKGIKLICLAGFMKILSGKFIKNFKGKIINIHPSLLPKYKGLNTHQRVIKKNEKYTGCTVHFVNKNLDSGKIIMQKRLKILKKDTISSLSKKLLMLEHKIYPKAIKKVIINL